MLAKYKSLFSSGSSNRLDQVDDPENSQPQNIPEERAAVTLMTSQYKISDTRTTVEQWKYYINILGWFLICYGSLGLILVFLGLVFADSQEFEITKPDGSFDTYYTSITFEVISRLLSNLSNISIIILGIGWRKASSRTTRAETWGVCKTAFYIAIFQAVIILIQFYLSGIVVLAVIKRWQERHDVSAGNYYIF